MEWFQQTDTEQKEEVNGCAEPPEGESGGSDSSGGTSASEATDLQELKTKESESEAEEDKDKEEREAVPASTVQKGERTRKEKKSVDGEEHKQSRSATSTYTGDLSRSASSSMLASYLLRTSCLFVVSHRPVPHLIAVPLGTAAPWPRRQHGGRDQRGV